MDLIVVSRLKCSCTKLQYYCGRVSRQISTSVVVAGISRLTSVIAAEISKQIITSVIVAGIYRPRVIRVTNGNDIQTCSIIVARISR
jgi:hypothetical protein